MNTHITAHKAKIRHRWFFLILCFHLVYGGVPGPCKHSVTQGHLMDLRRLIKNQLQNECSITYTFTERQNLSEVCYVKAAFPYILDLLNTQFRYAKDSDNYRYTNSLINVIYNIYSQRCIPSINEEIENSPAKFVKIHMTLARTALEKAEEVIRMYMDLMTKSDSPVDWNCEEEYTENYTESTAELLSQSTGVSECPCTCPTVTSGSFKTSMPTSQWSQKSTSFPQLLSFSPVETLQGSNARAKQLKSDVKHQGAISDTLSNPAPTLASQTPATVTPTEGDLHNFLFGSTPVLTVETSSTNSEMEYTLSSDVSPSSTPTMELADFFQGRTDLTIHSTMSGPYQRDKGDRIQNSVERSTALLLAKRSLNSNNHEGSSNSHNKLLQTWLTTTSDPTVDLKSTGNGITPVAKDKPFQMLQMSKHVVPVTSTVLSSLKTGLPLSEHLTTLVEQLNHLNSPPENVQIHTHTLVREPGNFLKSIHEKKRSKDSRPRKDKQEIKIHNPQDHQDRGTQRNSAMTQTNNTFMSFSSAFIITLVCAGLLLIIALFYRQHKVSDQRCLFEIYQNNVPSVASQTAQAEKG